MNVRGVSVYVCPCLCVSREAALCVLFVPVFPLSLALSRSLSLSALIPHSFVDLNLMTNNNKNNNINNNNNKKKKQLNVCPVADFAYRAHYRPHMAVLGTSVKLLWPVLYMTFYCLFVLCLFSTLIRFIVWRYKNLNFTCIKTKSWYNMVPKIQPHWSYFKLYIRI